MVFSKRVLRVCLISSIFGLLMMPGIGNAAGAPRNELAQVDRGGQEQPVGRVSDEGDRKTSTDGPAAKLVRVKGGVRVDGQLGSVGAPLDEGSRVRVAEDGTAVVEYRDGCRYRVEGPRDYIVNHAQCVCFENLDSNKRSQHGVVAELGRIEGTALVDKENETERLEGFVGMELKEEEVVMAMEDSSALVEYYFGCDYTVQEEEVYVVDAEGCCLAMLLPPSGGRAPVSPQYRPSGSSPGASALIPPAVAVGILGAAVGTDGASRLPPISE